LPPCSSTHVVVIWCGAMDSSIRGLAE
jgi:hypothetical protein